MGEGLDLPRFDDLELAYLVMIGLVLVVESDLVPGIEAVEKIEASVISGDGKWVVATVGKEEGVATCTRKTCASGMGY